MTLIEYFQIIENLRKWAIDKKYLFLRIYDELAESFPADKVNLRRNLLSLFMRSENRIKEFILHLKAIELLFDYLEIKNNVNSSIQKLSNSYAYSSGRDGLIYVFEDLIKNIRIYEHQIKEKLALLSGQERVRLQEAFHNLQENCYFSSTVNAVVALEFRLLRILLAQNKEILLKKNLKLRFTLGMLIHIYLINKKEFGNTVPDKFDDLLRLCNSYRIFSAHAKEEIINANDARAILSLTFSFLLDERCKIQF